MFFQPVVNALAFCFVNGATYIYVFISISIWKEVKMFVFDENVFHYLQQLHTTRTISISI